MQARKSLDSVDAALLIPIAIETAQQIVMTSVLIMPLRLLQEYVDVRSKIRTLMAMASLIVKRSVQPTL
jgi:hypothetical protein